MDIPQLQAHKTMFLHSSLHQDNILSQMGLVSPTRRNYIFLCGFLSLNLDKEKMSNSEYTNRCFIIKSEFKKLHKVSQELPSQALALVTCPSLLVVSSIST